MKNLFLLLFGGLLLCVPAFSQTADHDAIKRVCYEESMAYYARDFEKWASYHVQSSEADLAYNNPDGTYGYDSGWDKLAPGMKDWLQSAEKEEVKLVNSNFKFVIRGDMAFASYDSEQFNAAGKPTMKLREYRTLLRMDGQWKILAVQVYGVYLPGK